MKKKRGKSINMILMSQGNKGIGSNTRHNSGNLGEEGDYSRVNLCNKKFYAELRRLY